MRQSAVIGLLALASLFAGCGGRDALSGRDPLATAPSPVQVAPTPQVIVFRDAVTGFSTSDVRDADEQMVQFNTAGEVIWAADGTRFRGIGVNENSMDREGLEVQFGTKNGERRAYLTYSFNWYHYGPSAIVVDLEIVNGRLLVINVKPPVPLPSG